MSAMRNSSLLGKITILAFICFFVLPAQAKYGGGTGEPNDPYLIFDANQMNAIGADSNDWNKHFLLCADIDLSGFTGTSFNIIGTTNPFTGVFDGSGHTISNFTYTSTGTDNIGIFGYVGKWGVNAEIKDLRLINPDVDAGSGYNVGALVGYLVSGTITNCYVKGGSVVGTDIVGGLLGFNNDGKINASYGTDTVTGDDHVGGLVGQNRGTITDSHGMGSVTGDLFVGGIVGQNYLNATITNCFSTGGVSGIRYAGGLVGKNSGTISNCCSSDSVSGDERIGGLVGYNSQGTINNCYATGNISGDSFIGGLIGSNSGTITNCYANGSVSGNRYVGGLVARNYREVIGSFWDTQTSGQTTSDGGTGLTTAEMQTITTFTDAGWDFIGETANGIEDIWFIPKQDYPHLWWEGIQVPMKLTPRTLNCRSYGNWVKAHITLPQGFTVEDVDSNKPAVLHSFGFQSAPLYVSVNDNELVEVEAAFEREQVCSLTGDWPQALTVAGFLTDGNIFLGTSTVRMITPGANDIEDLALYWLNADCIQPDFCDGIDMNRDSMVNFPDYALLLNSQVEFIRE